MAMLNNQRVTEMHHKILPIFQMLPRARPQKGVELRGIHSFHGAEDVHLGDFSPRKNGDFRKNWGLPLANFRKIGDCCQQTLWTW